MGVKDVFDKYARSYDRARRKLVPCFDDFYGTVLGLIPYGPENEFRVLDLGAGTGLLSLLVSNTFPNARLTLVDLSQDMLARAQERFTDGAGRFDFIVADYAEGALPGTFDVIVSSLSIHHLPDYKKEALFKGVHSSLVKSGVFINADQVRGSTPEIEERYRKAWLHQVRSSGVSRGDLEAAFERMREDRMATLETQLRWLRAAGFNTVNCWYKNYSFVVYAGFKGGNRP